MPESRRYVITRELERASNMMNHVINHMANGLEVIHDYVKEASEATPPGIVTEEHIMLGEGFATLLESATALKAIIDEFWGMAKGRE